MSFSSFVRIVFVSTLALCMSAHAQDRAASAPASGIEIELGDLSGQGQPQARPSPGAQPAAGQAGPSPRSANRGKQHSAPGAAMQASPTSDMQDGVSRVTFNRRPIPVSLQVGREKLISFPGPVVLHVPAGAESTVRLQTIGRTVYATALAPFGSFRIIAEDLERDGRQFPVDLIARQGTVSASDEIEIHAPTANSGPPAQTSARAEAEPTDMVALTRYASQMLYAPSRLMPASSAIRQVPVKVAPVPGLYRGSVVITSPIAAWRTGSLYVTAVRVTNATADAMELDLDQLRGQWLAATAQHNRLGPRGSEADTTALYLVCDKPFEACR